MSTWIVAMDGVDRRLLLRLATLRHPVLTLLFRTLTRVADPVPMALLGALLLVGAFPLPEGVAGRGAALSLALAFGASQLLKRRISRPRPVLPVGFASLARAPDHFSFPSGHSAGALAVVLPVAGDLMAEGRVALAAICVVPALLVGVSRSYLGVHYPGDVVAGWALAIMAALVTHMVLP